MTVILPEAEVKELIDRATALGTSIDALVLYAVRQMFMAGGNGPIADPFGKDAINRMKFSVDAAKKML